MNFIVPSPGQLTYAASSNFTTTFPEEEIRVIEIERLTKIAQTLDELSDEGPTELAALAEEMGSLLDRVESQFNSLQAQLQSAKKGDEMPRYLREINSIVSQHVQRYLGLRDVREYEYRMLAEEQMRKGITFKGGVL